MMSTSNNLGKLGFYGKSFFIPGGDSGMGAATARLAATRRAKVLMASLNEETCKRYQLKKIIHVVFTTFSITGIQPLIHTQL